MTRIKNKLFFALLIFVHFFSLAQEKAPGLIQNIGRQNFDGMPYFNRSIALPDGDFIFLRKEKTYSYAIERINSKLEPVWSFLIEARNTNIEKIDCFKNQCSVFVIEAKGEYAGVHVYLLDLQNGKLIEKKALKETNSAKPNYSYNNAEVSFSPDKSKILIQFSIKLSNNNKISSLVLYNNSFSQIREYNDAIDSEISAKYTDYKTISRVVRNDGEYDLLMLVNRSTLHVCRYLSNGDERRQDFLLNEINQEVQQDNHLIDIDWYNSSDSTGLITIAYYSMKKNYDSREFLGTWIGNFNWNTKKLTETYYSASNLAFEKTKPEARIILKTVYTSKSGMHILRFEENYQAEYTRSSGQLITQYHIGASYLFGFNAKLDIKWRSKIGRNCVFDDYSESNHSSLFGYDDNGKTISYFYADNCIGKGEAHLAVLNPDTGAISTILIDNKSFNAVVVPSTVFLSGKNIAYITRKDLKYELRKTEIQ